MKNFISVPFYFGHQIISQTLLTEELFEPLLCEAKKKYIHITMTKKNYLLQHGKYCCLKPYSTQRDRLHLNSLAVLPASSASKPGRLPVRLPADGDVHAVLPAPRDRVRPRPWVRPQSHVTTQSRLTPRLPATNTR